MKTVEIAKTTKAKATLSAKLMATGQVVTRMHLTIDAEIEYQDFLAISASVVEGLQLCITPVRQPLAVDDAPGSDWGIPR